MSVVMMRKEYEHDSQEKPGSTGKLTERCMGVYPDFKTARIQVAAYLFDELHYHAGNSNSVIVSGAFSWKTQRIDDTSVCEVSIADTDYVFTAYILVDDED